LDSKTRKGLVLLTREGFYSGIVSKNPVGFGCDNPQGSGYLRIGLLKVLTRLLESHCVWWPGYFDSLIFPCLLRSASFK
jgi:hypothetical protein